MSIASASSAASSAGSAASSYANSGLDKLGGLSSNPYVQAGGAILNTASSYLQDKAMSAALKRQQAKQWEANLINTREAYRQQGTQMQAAAQDNAQAGLANQMSLAEQRAAVELMAAASGTGGASVTSMLTDLNAEGGRNQSQIIENYERQQESFRNGLKGIQSSGQMQIRKFEKPRLFNAIVKGTLSAATAYKTAKASNMKLEREGLG